MSRMARLARRLRRSTSGAAMVEFALAAPLLLTTGLWGVEAANQAIVQMRVSQIAILIADNASRVGEESLLGEVKLYETDINDTFYGAGIQMGFDMDLFENGRVILSSLEVVPGTDDRQYIHWQRCKGKKVHYSQYGDAGDGISTEIAGMGPSGEEIVAFEGEAVMFVEVAYDYQPLIGSAFTHADVMTATAAFNVRNNRDLSEIYQHDPDDPDEVALCSEFDSYPALEISGGGTVSSSSGGSSSGSSSSSSGGGASSGGGGGASSGGGGGASSGGGGGASSGGGGGASSGGGGGASSGGASSGG